MQGAYELLTHLSGGSQIPLTFGHVTKGKFAQLIEAMVVSFGCPAQ